MLDLLRIRGKILFWIITIPIVSGDFFACADSITLKNGDHIFGKVISQDSGKVVFESEMLGHLEIERGKVESVQQAGEKEGQSKDTAVPEGGKTGVAPEKLEVKPAEQLVLGGQVEMGLNGRTGNTKRMGYESNTKLSLTNDNWNISGYFKNRYAEQEVQEVTTRTDNEIKGGGRLQRKLYKKYSGFLGVDLERDEFEELRLRSMINGGLGYLWLKSEEWFYENRIGLGCRHERFEEGVSQESMVGNLTSELRYKINEHIDITQETAWVMNLQDRADYSLNAESGAIFYLTKKRNLFIKSGLKHEYENQPGSREVERLDTFYFSNLGYKF